MALIHLFVRHATFSSISQHKKRPPLFSRLHCFENLLKTAGDLNSLDITLFIDLFAGKNHFLLEESRFKQVHITAGTEASSFLQLLHHIEELNLPDEAIVYLVEDDYLHTEGWVDALLDGFSIPGVDYVTLYDHPDKYTPAYRRLASKLFVSKTGHWRTVPSTTHTFACRMGTLRRDKWAHRLFSSYGPISKDHLKFSLLTKLGRTIISPLPGKATHVESANLSPLVDWDTFLA